MLHTKRGLLAALALLSLGLPTLARADGWTITIEDGQHTVTVKRGTEVVSSDTDPEAASGGYTSSNGHIHASSWTENVDYTIDVIYSRVITGTWSGSGNATDVGWQASGGCSGGLNSGASTGAVAKSFATAVPGSGCFGLTPPNPYSDTFSVSTKINNGTTCNGELKVASNSEKVGAHSAADLYFALWMTVNPGPPPIGN